MTVILCSMFIVEDVIHHLLSGGEEAQIVSLVGVGAVVGFATGSTIISM